MSEEITQANFRTARSKRDSRPKSVLFVYEKSHRRRFVELDLMILRRNYRVTKLEYDVLLGMIKQLGAIGLVRLVRSSDLIVSWWGDRHSAFLGFLGRILGRPTIVISGGYDVVRMPEIGYGLGNTFRGRLCAYLAFHLSTKVVVNSTDSKKTIVRNYRVPRNKVEVVYHGTDVFGVTPEWKYEKKRNGLAIAVGKVSWLNLRRKGFEAFVLGAAFLPTAEFRVIGPWMDDSIEYLKQIAPKNVTFRTNVGDSELVESYRHAKVIVQASYHEGFGCALAEAMTFGCVPVVTPRGALPEVVGETGYYVEYGRPEDLASAIGLAMNDAKKACLASERATRLFTVGERQRRFLEMTEGLMKKA